MHFSKLTLIIISRLNWWITISLLRLHSLTQIHMHSYIYLPTHKNMLPHTWVRSYTYTPSYSNTPTHLVIHRFTQTFMHSVVHNLVYSFINSCTQAYTLTHTRTVFIHSHTHIITCTFTPVVSVTKLHHIASINSIDKILFLILPEINYETKQNWVMMKRGVWTIRPMAVGIKIYVYAYKIQRRVHTGTHPRTCIIYTYVTLPPFLSFPDSIKKLSHHYTSFISPFTIKFSPQNGYKSISLHKLFSFYVLPFLFFLFFCHFVVKEKMTET